MWAVGARAGPSLSRPRPSDLVLSHKRTQDRLGIAMQRPNLETVLWQMSWSFPTQGSTCLSSTPLLTSQKHMAGQGHLWPWVGQSLPHWLLWMDPHVVGLCSECEYQGREPVS